MGCSLHFNTYI